VDRTAKIQAEVESLLAASEYEVVDVQCTGSPRGLVVRIFVDRGEGVSLEDCARVSRAVGDHFDTKGILTGHYVLEVSSPGVDRPLKRPADYRRFEGETAQVSTYEKIDGRHNHLGVLAGYDEDRQEVLLRTEAGEVVAVPLGAIKKAHLKRDPWERGPGKRTKPE
jgi:ribosome maturation factor RimP